MLWPKYGLCHYPHPVDDHSEKTDGWKKKKENAKKKEYVELKKKVQQPKTGDLVRIVELKMG